MKPVSLFIGWRYLRGRSGDKFSRFVSYMSMAGIMIGVMALITILSVMNGFEQQLKGRLLGVLPHAVVTQGQSTLSVKPELPASVQGVSRITPLTRTEAVLQSTTSLAAIDLLGIEPTEYEPLALHMTVGRVKSLVERDYHIVLGRNLANQLNVKVGDKVRVMVTSASQYTPIGRIPSQRNFTVSGIFSSLTDLDGQMALAHIGDVGRLMRLQSGEIGGWRLFAQDPFAVPQLQQQFDEQWLWHDWREQRGELFQAVKMEKNMMSLMLGLVIAVAAFNIISSLIMVVMEKQSEVAILKTQGMKPNQIQQIFMFQGALSGLIGSLVGGILGVILSLNLNGILTALGATTLLVGGHLPVIIQPSQIALIILFSILLSFAATLFPAYRAAKLRPAETLRYE